MSTNSEGMVLVREKIPYSGKGPEALLGMIRRVLAENPYTQEFTCRVGQPIEIAKLVPPDQVPVKVNLHDALRTKKMEEHPFEQGKTPFQRLWDMFELVYAEGLQVCTIAVGDKFAFQKWLGVRIPQNRMSFYGTPIVHLAELPDDVFILAGAEQGDAEVSDIKYSIKGTIV